MFESVTPNGTAVECTGQSEKKIDIYILELDVVFARKAQLPQALKRSCLVLQSCQGSTRKCVTLSYLLR